MTEINTEEKKPEQAETIENRLDLIETALRFLKNPKVAQTADNAKRQFLSKKGLTESEIKIALEKANAYFKENPLPTTSPISSEVKNDPSQVISNNFDNQVKPNL